MIARVFGGKPEELTRDDVLDNGTLYWLTNTAVSAARLYWDTSARRLLPCERTQDPVAVSVFAEEIYQAPKSWTEKACPKLIFYKAHEKGTHFAAEEQPEAFVSDLRQAFRSLRQ